MKPAWETPSNEPRVGVDRAVQAQPHVGGAVARGVVGRRQVHVGSRGLALDEAVAEADRVQRARHPVGPRQLAAQEAIVVAEAVAEIVGVDVEAHGLGAAGGAHGVDRRQPIALVGLDPDQVRRLRAGEVDPLAGRPAPDEVVLGAGRAHRGARDRREPAAGRRVAERHLLPGGGAGAAVARDQERLGPGGVDDRVELDDLAGGGGRHRDVEQRGVGLAGRQRRGAARLGRGHRGRGDQRQRDQGVSGGAHDRPHQSKLSPRPPDTPTWSMSRAWYDTRSDG
jgi:hypothetical protein